AAKARARRSMERGLPIPSPNIYVGKPNHAWSVRGIPSDSLRPGNALKWDRKDPVSILIVNANVPTKERMHEFVNFSGTCSLVRIVLPELRNVQAEVAMFRALDQVNEGGRFKLDLASAQEYRLGCPVNKVTILDRESTDGNILGALKSELTEQPPKQKRFDILHFAEHACDIGRFVSAPDGTVVLALPCDPGAVYGLGLAELTSWPGESLIQMVYLSCCAATPGHGGAAVSGSTAAVAQLMAQSQVPVKLGFRWNIDDKKGFKFAASF
ncbi:MAG: CHAT domain-containing protein, partial [Pseudomonadota bacterium]